MENRELIKILNRYKIFEIGVEQAQSEILALFNVSQRSKLLKAESPERSFNQYLAKYFEVEPTTELIYRQKFNGKRMAEKDIIKMYLQAHCLL